jgi:hypothetical protein
MTDTTMEAITKAVTAGQTGDTAGAKRQLLELWDSIGDARWRTISPTCARMPLKR